MANYKIIGADLIEYGPVSAEQIRQWINEGRVDAETKLQTDGTAEWKLLAEVPEFGEAPPATTPPACPKCGEPFENGFDSCWKCGTNKDGTPAKEWTPVEDPAEEVAEPCPKCGGTNVSRGKVLPSGHGISAEFRPEGARSFVLSFKDGVDLSSNPSFACLDCGLVWDYLRPEELKEFISKYCGGSDKEDPYALLSEAARLESKGDIAGALATYEAVRQGFEGTEAARDAEASIRSLKEKAG